MFVAASLTAAERRAFDIPAGTADQSLRQFTTQSGAEAVYAAEVVRGISTPAVKGTVTPAEALTQLLAPTGLTAEQDERTATFRISRDPNGARTASAPTPAPTNSSPQGAEKAIELSPFEVHAEDDVGYQAGNTTSGSRLNSSLKDTAASISPFTREFLSDIGATNLEEMLKYANNVESEVEDAQAGFNNPPGRDSTGGDYAFRVRGVIGGVSRDYVDATAPNDTYNVERAEVSSGPNSILFGLGSAGGLVSLTGKKANVNRTKLSLKTVFAEYDYQRYELDFNQALVKNTLGLRLLGLHQTAEAWRKWSRRDQDRFTGAVTYRPFKKTTIDGSYEKGHSANSLSVSGNAVDQLSLWTANGRPAADGAAVAGTARFATGTDRFTLNGNSGVIYNLKGELQSSSSFTSATLLPTSLAPNQYNYIGPGGLRLQHFSNYNVNVEQRVTPTLTVIASLYHNEGLVKADGTNTSLPELRGDPNLTLPAPSGGTATVANPDRGRLYMESTWFKDNLLTTNDVVRGTTAYELDLGPWFGRHRMAALAEHSKQERTRRWRNESLVDANNVPITNAATPEGAQNQLTRRTYATEGDFNTYYVGDPRDVIAPITYNGRTLHSRFINRIKSNAHAFKEINSYMFADQTSWFKNRLVTTVGYRLDQVTFRNENEERVTNPADARIASDRFILNEWDFNGIYTTNRYSPKTITAGAVFHATKRFSVFYNTSENNGAPRFDRKVLPDGGVPPPITGSGRDMGVMIDFLGDNRYFLRAAYYKSEQLNDASVIPDGLTVNTSNSLGGDNLLNIVGALRDAGKLTAAQFDAQSITYNAGIIDIFTKGYETEFVANPTRNLTVRLGYSYTDRKRGNFYKEIFAFYAKKFPEWRALAAGNPSLLNTVNNEIATIESELAFQTTRQSAPFGTRPHKANITGRYSFTESRLKGTFVGGSVRYQSRNFVSTDSTTGRDYWGTPTVFADAFAGYRSRLPWRKLPYNVQLNVTNVTNSYLVGVGRYNTTYNGLFRVYLNDPRAYRLTVGIDY
jgi:outer membrane receptor protein involved in Fe transport